MRGSRSDDLVLTLVSGMPDSAEFGRQLQSLIVLKFEGDSIGGRWILIAWRPKRYIYRILEMRDDQLDPSLPISRHWTVLQSTAAWDRVYK